MRLDPRKLPRFIAPLALMAGIFLLSAQPNLGTDLGLIDLIGRKIAHVAVYGALTLLWLWAIGPQLGRTSVTPGPTRGEARPSPCMPFRALALAGVLAFAYAVFDEYHQSGVAGRSGSAVDVTIDSAGILGAVWLVASGCLARPLAAAQRIYERARRRDPARRSD